LAVANVGHEGVALEEEVAKKSIEIQNTKKCSRKGGGKERALDPRKPL